MKKIILLFVVFTSSLTFAATVNGFDLEAYGFLKASAAYSTEALASYNNINMSAPTHAPAQTRSQDKTGRMSFQAQQSRVGLNLKKTDDLKAKFEFDFIDFSKSSPTTQMQPRVRIASISYHWDNSTIVVGQDWDMFSPVTTYTFDYVGLYFMAGNTGFMRQQFQYLNRQGDWEFGAALGMAGNNPGVTDNDLELARSPSYAGRITRFISNGRVGLSGIYARLNYETTTGRSHDSYGANAFYEQVFNRMALKSELYYAQNLANIGSLSLGKGTNTSDVKEFGGTFTLQLKVNDTNNLFGGFGLARVDNRSQLTPFLMPATNIISQPGVRSNFVSRVGLEHKITPDFSWITEMGRIETQSKVSQDKYKTVLAGMFESGFQLRF